MGSMSSKQDNTTGARDKVRAFLEANVGKVVTTHHG